jgi:lysophospholipase L1-like esterase
MALDPQDVEGRDNGGVHPGPGAVARWWAVPTSVAAVLVLGGCSTEGATSGGAGAPAAVTGSSAGPPASSTPAPAPGEVTFVTVGDSLTAWAPSAQDIGIAGAGSWVQAASVAPVRFGGGWAVSGARTADMLAHVTPYQGDVLLLLAGTNDVTAGVAWAESEDNLRGIVAAAGVPDVVVSAIPPSDPRPDATADYNRRLVALAAQEGWRFVDPWTDVTVDGTFRPGATVDGVHPTVTAADQAGVLLRAALLDAAVDQSDQPGR